MRSKYAGLAAAIVLGAVVVASIAPRPSGPAADGTGGIGTPLDPSRVESLEERNERLSERLEALSASVAAHDRVLFAQPEADRRPVGWIPTHGAPRDRGNPGGLRRQFHDPAAGYEWLKRELVSRPFTRFIIHQPAGWQKQRVEGTRMGGAQYWPIDDEHLAMWKAAIRDAMQQRPEITVGIYGSIKGQYTHSTEMSDWRVFDFSRAQDRWFVWHQAVAPWVRAGVYEYWFDNGSPPGERRSNALAFASWLMRTRYVHSGIEAIPYERTRTGRVPDADALATTPSLALLRYVRNADPEGQWDVRGAAFEVVVVLLSGTEEPVPTVEELVDLLRRGFVLGSGGIRGADDLVVAAYQRWRSLSGE